MRMLIVAILAVLLAGCSSPISLPSDEVRPARIVARDSAFVVLVAQKDEDFSDLARQFYGDSELAWVISDFNQAKTLNPGEVLAIPLVPPNRLGVTSAGYQTVPILCYHRTGAGKGKLIVSASAFEEQMRFLANNGYRVVPLEQLKGFLRGETRLHPKTVSITFDDGYRSFYEVAFPILRKFRFPATLFVYTDFVGAADALSWEQMAEIKASGLIHIQPHSKTHGNLAVKLTRESDSQYRERLHQEVDTPVEVLKTRLSVSSNMYALPYGDTHDMLSGLLQQHGIDMAFTVTPGGNGFFAYPYMLRRTMVFGDDSLQEFRAKLTIFSSIPR